MYCRQCGKPVEGDQEFCEECKALNAAKADDSANINANDNSTSNANSNSTTNTTANSNTTEAIQNVDVSQNSNTNSNSNYNGSTSSTGTAQNPNYNYNYSNYSQPRSRLAAGLFGIFLGALGIHNFYLGFTGKAIAQLLISVLTCGILSWVSAIWGLIEGILILTGSINTDASGNRLVE